MAEIVRRLQSLKPAEASDVMTPCGIVDHTVEDIKRKRNNEQVLRNRRGNVVCIRNTHAERKFNLVDDGGTSVPASAVAFFPAFDTEEKQAAEAKRLYTG